MLPESMSQSKAAALLAELQVELTQAGEAFDWELVARLDKEVRNIAEAFPKDRRSPVLTQAMTEMKTCYEQLFDDSKARKQELRKELGQMRGKREALDGYKASLAAGNRELRVSA